MFGSLKWFGWGAPLLFPSFSMDNKGGLHVKLEHVFRSGAPNGEPIFGKANQLVGV